MDFNTSEFVAKLLANPLIISLIAYVGILVIMAVLLVIITLRLHHANQKKAAKWAEMEARWKPLLMRVLAGEAWPDEIQTSIGDGEGLYFIDYLMRYAEKLSGETRRRATALADPYLPKLLSRVHKGDAEQRARAILTLSILAPEDHQDRMVQALEDESPLVATMAARALAENGEINYLNPILEKMPRFRSWSQTYLVSMLVSLGKDQPEYLREALVLTHQPNWVKTVIMKALTEINDWNALPLAVQFLQEDADREVQAASLQFLARIGHDGLLDLIRQKCRHDDFVIRLNAVKALANLGTPEDRELLLQLLHDPSQWIALQAAQALKATHNLEDLLQVAESTHPRAELAREVLYDLESRETIEFLSRTEHFAEHAAQWMRTVKRKDIRDTWKLVQQILLSSKTPDNVKMALARELDVKTPGWFYEALEAEFLNERQTPGLYLVKAMHRSDALRALDAFKNNFFTLEDPLVQYEVFRLLKRKPQNSYLNFYKKLQHALMQTPEQLAIPAAQVEEVKKGVDRLIHKSLLGEEATGTLDPGV